MKFRYITRILSKTICLLMDVAFRNWECTLAHGIKIIHYGQKREIFKNQFWHGMRVTYSVMKLITCTASNLERQ